MEYVPLHPLKAPLYDMSLTGDGLREIFRGAADFSSRKIFLGGDREHPAEIFYIDGLVSSAEIEEALLKPLISSGLGDGDFPAERTYSASVKEAETMDEACDALVRGFAVLIPEKGRVLAFEAKTGEKRSISEPRVENTVKGTKDAFVETLRTNTSLIRRHTRTPELKISEVVVGRQSRTAVDVVYIRGIASENTVAELLGRLDRLDGDGILSTEALEQGLFPEKSLLPRLIYTERTDRFCTGLTEGRIGLLADGIPLGFLLPATLSELMKTPEDKSEKPLIATCLRGLRYLALLTTLLLPGLYLAVRLHHSEMLPPVLLEAILKSKEHVAAGTAAEVIALLLCFELLQEAGLRLPQNIGQTLGVIGGLVVGTAAVEASLISPAVLVVVSLAGIAGYTIPNQDLSNAIRLWRFIIAIGAWALGLPGVLTACLLLLTSMASLKDFGVSYLAPLATEAPGRVINEVTVPPEAEAPYRPPELRPKNKRRWGK